MTKTAEMVPCPLGTQKKNFFLGFDLDDTIPPLLQLVQIIEYGPDNKFQLLGFYNVRLSFCPMFNNRENTQIAPVQHRHTVAFIYTADRVTLFCVYLGLLFIAKTREKNSL